MKHLLFKALALLAITILSACANGSQTLTNQGGLVDVAEITQNGESYLGKSVLVRNDVLKTIGQRGLILDKDRVFSGNNILVINSFQMPLKILKTNSPEVLISGKVEQFFLADFPQKYDINLDSDLYSQYENQLVIIAESLLLSPDPEDLTRNPEKYYNKLLAVEGEIEDQTSYGIFELDEQQVFGGEDLIVLQPKPRIKLDEEQTVIVYGTLRRFIVAELIGNYDLGWDLSTQQQMEAEYSQKPVFVADKIQIIKP